MKIQGTAATPDKTRETSPKARDAGPLKLAIVGNPNVGKSVIFNNLTGLYATVSNYPGTTVEISRGNARVGGVDFEVIDTPGAYSLLPITEEERVTRRVLLDEGVDVVVHVIDAKNVIRMLPFALQLIEAGLPVILVVNMADEAEHLGIRVDVELLEERLGIPVVLTASTTGRGMEALRRRITEFISNRGESGSELGKAGAGAVESGAELRPVYSYSDRTEKAIAAVEALLEADYPVSRRAAAIMLLNGEAEIEALVSQRERHAGEVLERVEAIAREIEGDMPFAYSLAMERQAAAAALVKGVLTRDTRPRPASAGLSGFLSRLTMNPLTGIPILILVLYFGLYRFVGGFGAGTVVDFLETAVFERWVNPFVDNLARAFIPYEAVRSLLAGDYGVITLGLRYAVAIVLPIVGSFFLVFSIIEDSGYLPRLAMLVDRVFKVIGLTGRSVIPITLGFGCGTMATLVTRTLETRRERIIATLLLALAIPCSAQLGVIMGLLAARPGTLLVWVIFVGAAFVVTGRLAAVLLPGESPSFYMELPPLRLPSVANVVSKTLARMKWYFLEIVPIFILASVLIWFGKLTGLFEVAIRLIEPLVVAMGLPPETTVAFLFGFFRRDYGAAGLYDLAKAGALSGRQLVVASIALTLFIPCIAQFSVMIKERGIAVATLIAAFAFSAAFTVGYVANLILGSLGVIM
ncbi:MAG: ferrous iron transport protein B [Firmicutes bacterium]|nr:ferrous iron transport protein B [Bacillota bacterium]